MSTPAAAPELLRLDHVQIAFGQGSSSHVAVYDVSLTVRAGEVVGLVGESGSGKSLTCRAVLRLLPGDGQITSGSVSLAGDEVLSMSKHELRNLRAHQVGMIFQDPFTSLNPTLRIGKQLMEVLRVNAGLSKSAARQRAIELLVQVEIPRPDERMRAYPHEMSGGMQQRVMIAMALASDPHFLLADEPTTALDVSTQAQVLDLLSRIRDERGISILIVSHDFGVIGSLCDRVVVMYGGYVVESGTLDQVYGSPAHPYTQALIDAVPNLDIPEPGYRRPAIPGPPLGTTPYVGGCPFAPRCVIARDECQTLDILLQPVEDGHLTACPFAAEGSEPLASPTVAKGDAR